MSKLEERDVKGLYAKARAGEIPHFTGVSDPYEPPDKAEVTVHTGEETVDESANRVIRTLELIGYIPTEDAVPLCSPEKEAEIRERLRSLGYI